MKILTIDQKLTGLQYYVSEDKEATETKTRTLEINAAFTKMRFTALLLLY